MNSIAPNVVPEDTICTMDQNSAMSFAAPYCIPMQNNVMPRNTINKSLCQEFYFFIDKIPLFSKYR